MFLFEKPTRKFVIYTKFVFNDKIKFYSLLLKILSIT